MYICEICSTGYDLLPGADAPSRCNKCGVWGRITSPDRLQNGVIALDKVQLQTCTRLIIGRTELDKFYGDPNHKSPVGLPDPILGIRDGSTNLLIGSPGAGKSTLLLQIAASLASLGKAVFYGSSEETQEEIKERALRLNLDTPPGKVQLCYGRVIEEVLPKVRPDLLILDSLQHFSSINSNIVHDVALIIDSYCKETKTPAIIAVQVNKQNLLSGAQAIVHLVSSDALLRKRRNGTRLLTVGEKNRFAPTHTNKDDDMVKRYIRYNMTSTGLEATESVL